MIEQRESRFELGSVSCSVSVRAALVESGVTQDEILRFHQFASTEDLRADHWQAIENNDWICSPFELARIGKTVWAITDPDRASTTLLLEE